MVVHRVQNERHMDRSVERIHSVGRTQNHERHEHHERHERDIALPFIHSMHPHHSSVRRLHEAIQQEEADSRHHRPSRQSPHPMRRLVQHSSHCRRQHVDSQETYTHIRLSPLPNEENSPAALRESQSLPHPSRMLLRETMRRIPLSQSHREKQLVIRSDDAADDRRHARRGEEGDDVPAGLRHRQREEEVPMLAVLQLVDDVVAPCVIATRHAYSAGRGDERNRGRAGRVRGGRSDAVSCGRGDAGEYGCFMPQTRPPVTMVRPTPMSICVRREERVYEREAAQIGLGVLAREDGEIHRQNTHAARVIEERRGDV